MASSSLTLADRNSLIKAISMHFVIYSQKAELDDIKHGLEDVLHFGDIMHSHPTLLKPLFVSSGRSKLSANSFLSLFKINYSPQGSNMRESEEDVMLHFNYYIEELEGKLCQTTSVSVQYTLYC